LFLYFLFFFIFFYFFYFFFIFFIVLVLTFLFFSGVNFFRNMEQQPEVVVVNELDENDITNNNKRERNEEVVCVGKSPQARFMENEEQFCLPRFVGKNIAYTGYENVDAHPVSIGRPVWHEHQCAFCYKLVDKFDECEITDLDKCPFCREIQPHEIPCSGCGESFFSDTIHGLMPGVVAGFTLTFCGTDCFKRARQEISIIGLNMRRERCLDRTVDLELSATIGDLFAKVCELSGLNWADPNEMRVVVLTADAEGVVSVPTVIERWDICNLKALVCETATGFGIVPEKFVVEQKKKVSSAAAQFVAPPPVVAKKPKANKEIVRKRKEVDEDDDEDDDEDEHVEEKPKRKPRVVNGESKPGRVHFNSKPDCIAFLEKFNAPKNLAKCSQSRDTYDLLGGESKAKEGQTIIPLKPGKKFFRHPDQRTVSQIRVATVNLKGNEVDDLCKMDPRAAWYVHREFFMMTESAKTKYGAHHWDLLIFPAKTTTLIGDVEYSVEALRKYLSRDLESNVFVEHVYNVMKACKCFFNNNSNNEPPAEEPVAKKQRNEEESNNNAFVDVDNGDGILDMDIADSGIDLYAANEDLNRAIESDQELQDLFANNWAAVGF